MEQTEKKTRQRLYKVAAELNLSHDVLIEFLAKKGHQVKNHMSPVDEDMMVDILKHFKKEKVDADRHARKRKEYDEKDKKRRGEVKKEEPKPEAKPRPKEAEPREAAPAEAPAPEAVVVEPVEAVPEVSPPVSEPEVPAAEVPIEEEIAPPAEVPVVEAPTPQEAEAPAEEAMAVEAPAGEPEEPAVAEAGEAVVEAPAAETEAAAGTGRRRRKKSTEPLDVSLEASMPKMGLKVMGKIDLEALKKQKKTKETAAKTEKGKVEAGKAGPKRAGAPIQESAELKAKKKKKKIIREAPAPPPEVPETEEVKKKKRPLKAKGPVVDMAEVQEAIRRTLAQMEETGGVVAGRAATRRKKREKKAVLDQKLQAIAEREKSIVRVTDFMTVNELAGMMHVSAAEVISKLMNMGVMASINQRLEADVITLVAADFGFDVEKHDAMSLDGVEDAPDNPDDLRPRPPIVTIMGHVDHGKTSLLDYIRESNVVAGESGGITQHIGAYTVSLDGGRRITFLDTPGHEAFTAMRARGAQVTDIVVLVVAADDSVMPQTVEAISHALAANVPIIIAINKIDKSEANPERIRQQLADKNILVEEWGGRYGCVEISAKKGLHIDDLLNRILLEADILDLKANPDRRARGVVIEAKLDRGAGIVGTVLIQKGTLSVGEPFVVGSESGKVRALMDERGNRVDVATPSMPVQITGFDGIPQAGDVFVVLDSDREAREISNQRQQVKREMALRAMQRKTLDDISEQIKMGGVRELSLLVKGDVDGSVEALADSLMKLSTDEVRVNVIHRGVGAISESDVLLASASDAIIIGFHVRPHLNARKLAAVEHVDIRHYEIIYNAIQDVKNALEGLLAPEVKEEVTATIEVRETFRISRVGTIAGCYVQDGKINRNNRVRLLRDGIVLFTGGISTLKRFKDDVREVEQGYECGISLEGYNDIKVGDTIEAFHMVETKRVLA